MDICCELFSFRLIFYEFLIIDADTARYIDICYSLTTATVTITTNKQKNSFLRNK